MSACCTKNCSTDKPPVEPRYRRVLWIALAINLLMFGVELAGGLKAESVSLLADAVDFLGDAGNYALSIFTLALAPVWRSRTALLKGIAMGSYGIFVLGKAAWCIADGTVPEPATMGLIGFLALIANASVAMLLYAFRASDANMRAVWLCSRNDAIGNIAVMIAALGVFGTAADWPDILVAILMGSLAIIASKTVITQSRAELRSDQAPSKCRKPLASCARRDDME